MKTKEEIQEQVRLIAYKAWQGAANSFRLYPENKHTFHAYWDGAKNQFDEETNLFLQQTGKPSVDKVVVHEIITSPSDYDRILEGKNREIAYWRQRCEAAEAFIEFSPIEPDINGLQIAAHKRWLELKSKSLTP